MAQNWSATSPMNWREKILFGFLYGLVYIISLSPFWLLYLMSDGLCVLVYDIVGYRKKVVKKNLRNSFPEKSEAELLHIEKGFYHYFCDYIFETIKLASVSKATMKRRVTYTNMQIINDACKAGKGVALYMGHYGNWEWITSIGLYLSPAACPGQLYHILESKVMDRLMLRLRGKMGTENIPTTESLRRIIKMRQEHKSPVIGFISDQRPILYSVPYWTLFLNHDTPFISGTERLAKKLDMMCAYLDVKRVRRGYYEVDVQVLADNVKAIPDWEITERYARAMERTIRRQPEYWLWSHNRWKRGREEYKNAVKGERLKAIGERFNVYDIRTR